MTAPVPLRPVAPTDFDALVAINNRAVPAVNALDEADFRWFADCAPYFRVAETGGRPAGFLLALGPGLDYGSLNYRWFAARYDAFLYIDRIVVAPDFRSAGLGSAFYSDLAAMASAERVPRLACEVNERPPNEASMRFHRRHGFRPVGRQDTEGGSKTVCLMVRELAPPAR